MDSTLVRKYCELSADAQRILHMAVERMHLSMRAYTRVIKVARSIADLRQDEKILSEHIAEAIQYRELDQKYWR